MKLWNFLLVVAYYFVGFFVLYSMIYLGLRFLVGFDLNFTYRLGGLAGGAIQLAVTVGIVWLLRYGRRRIWHLPKKPPRHYPLVDTRNNI